MHIRMYTSICAHTHTDTDKDAHTPTQTYINFGYATLDTLMMRPIVIDPKVSILHM